MQCKGWSKQARVPGLKRKWKTTSIYVPISRKQKFYTFIQI